MIQKSFYLSIAVCLLIGCNEKQPISLTAEQQQQQQDFLKKKLDDMVFIHGGSFMMGSDFDDNSKPKHKVTLDGFSLSRFKVTFNDYLLYRQLTGQSENPYPETIKDNKELENAKQNWADRIAMQLNNSATIAPWGEARNYCLWLGEKTGLPIDLPTEAQWEYAAKFYGQWGLATDTLSIDPGFNVPIPLQANVSAFIGKGGVFPVGSFPPNRLGLYDMAGGGYEWVFDWYDSQYYVNSPELNPRGPEKGELIYFSVLNKEKGQYQAHVLRNFGFFIFTSGSASLRAKRPDTTYNNQSGYMDEFTFRCAINQPEAITQ